MRVAAEALPSGINPGFTRSEQRLDTENHDKVIPKNKNSCGLTNPKPPDDNPVSLCPLPIFVLNTCAAANSAARLADRRHYLAAYLHFGDQEVMDKINEEKPSKINSHGICRFSQQ